MQYAGKLHLIPCRNMWSKITKNCCRGAWVSSSIRPNDSDVSSSSFTTNLKTSSRLERSTAIGSCPCTTNTQQARRLKLSMTWAGGSHRLGTHRLSQQLWPRFNRQAEHCERHWLTMYRTRCFWCSASLLKSGHECRDDWWVPDITHIMTLHQIN